MAQGKVRKRGGKSSASRRTRESKDNYQIFSQISKEPKPMVFNAAEEINSIKERNLRVEREKAWEMSIERRIIITILSYVIAGSWLVIISDTNPWLKALVPAVGYFLSTLSLSFAKHYWVERRMRKIVSKNTNPPPLI